MGDNPDRAAGPRAILSSRTRGWTGISAELFRSADHEIVARQGQHLVSVLCEGRARLTRSQGQAPEDLEILAGEAVITPAGSPERWRCIGRNEVLHIAMHPAFMDNTVRAATGRTCAFKLRGSVGTRDRVIESIASSLVEELRGELVGGRIYVQAIATLLAVHLARHHASEHGIEEPRLKMSSYQLRRVQEFVEAHIGEDVTIEKMAAVVGCSPGHFAHCFKAATSTSPHKYVMERRLQRAKVLLRESRLSLTEIASRVGYASASHLCVSFRTAEHMSPSDCRERG